MPIVRSDAARLIAGAVALVFLAACSGASTPPEASTESSDPTERPGVPGAPGLSADVESAPVPADLAAQLDELLRRRAAAVRHGDLPAFRSDLAEDAGLRTAQEAYFDNLAQLPIETFRYSLYPASLVRSRGSYWAVVEVSLQLEPYDVVPVRTLDRYRFSPTSDGSRLVLSSVTDAEWEAANDVREQPWDVQQVRIIEGGGALGVFDPTSVGAARKLVRSVERGIADVRERVPYDWSTGAIFYALSDLAFLETFDNLPGGDTHALDGVAFTVSAGIDESTPTTSPVIASTRFALTPSMVGQDGAARNRLVRHELVHVAVADHDDDAPVWLSEGLAEWVSVQALAPQDRRVSEGAITAAEQGITRMPGDASFNDDDAEVHYAIGWWTCEYLAATYGETAPWVLLDRLADQPELDDRAVVKSLLGLSVDQLARRAAKLMLTTYQPEPLELEPPSDGASTGG